MKNLNKILFLTIFTFGGAAQADGEPKEISVNNPIVITSNELDRRKTTSNNEVVVSTTPAISIQERQFCRIIENFRVENALALTTANEIKINETYKKLSQSLNSLLPNGQFKGWLMRTVSVHQDAHGYAKMILELPCKAKAGPLMCDSHTNIIYGSARQGSRLYTEMAKMTIGDYAVVNGHFDFAEPSAFHRDRSLPSFRFFKTAPHCVDRRVPADVNFMGMHLHSVSIIK